MNISILSVDDLMYDEYCLYARDAVIYKCMQSEEGREYLEKCWRLQQTEPDTEKLKKIFGRKEETNVH